MNCAFCNFKTLDAELYTFCINCSACFSTKTKKYIGYFIADNVYQDMKLFIYCFINENYMIWYYEGIRYGFSFKWNVVSNQNIEINLSTMPLNEIHEFIKKYVDNLEFL